MAKQNAVVTKIDAGFEKFCRDLAIDRYRAGKEKKLLPPREITRMFMNSDAKNTFRMEVINKDRRMNI